MVNEMSRDRSRTSALTRWRRPWLACIIIGAVGFGTSMKASATEDNNAAWAIFTTTSAIRGADGSSRWHYWFDAQARNFDLGSGINQYLLRPGTGYEVNDNLTAWAGYARLLARGRSGIVLNEDRIWQQLTWVAVINFKVRY